MGKMKELLIELEEQAQERHLAKIIGIEFEDFQELDYEITEITDNEDNIIQYEIVFNNKTPENVFRNARKKISNNRIYLDNWEFEADYDYIGDQFDAITQSKLDYEIFKNDIDKILALSTLQSNGEKYKEILNRQIFISLIGALEVYLSDNFLRLVFENHIFLVNFVENHPHFKSEKFELRQIFKKNNEINNIAKRIILDTIFHNLSTVKEMYESTFAIKFPQIKNLSLFVFIRHDLVHRNGKTKDGTRRKIDDELLQELYNELNMFVYDLSNELITLNG